MRNALRLTRYLPAFAAAAVINFKAYSYRAAPLPEKPEPKIFRLVSNRPCEDRHSTLEIDDGVYALAVFDGHGGWQMVTLQ